MYDSSTMAVNLCPSLLNPWRLNFQKLGLELKCPRCLKLFTGPILLRCNHIICSSCVSSVPNARSECRLYKAQVVDRVTRPMSLLENLVAIYKSLGDAFSDMIQLVSSDAGGAIERCPSLANNNFGWSLIKDQYESGQLDKSSGRQQSKKSLKLSFHDGIEGDFDRYEMRQDVKGCISEMDGNGGHGESDEFRLSQTELNQTEQLSPNAPSVGDGKGSEFSCDEYHDHSSENSVDKRPDSRTSGDKSKVSRHASTLSDKEGNFRDAKRQKNFYPGQLELGKNDENDTQLVLQKSDKVTMASELKHSPCFSLTSSQQRTIPDKASENNTICAFCQSCTISEVTGQMLSYANGSLVLGNDATSLTLYMFTRCALNAVQNLLVKFAKVCGATVIKFWKLEVTHVVASTDENDACTRTFKVLMAILNGRWVLNMDWIKACLEANCVVNEEPYEISLDNYGCSDGAKMGRMRAVDNAPKLFSGLSFCFVGDNFLQAYKEDLKELVTAAGGTVVQFKEDLAALNQNDQPSPGTLVVYYLKSPAGCMLGEEVSILWQRLNEAENIAAQIDAKVVSNTWLVESTAACKLQNLVS